MDPWECPGWVTGWWCSGQHKALLHTDWDFLACCQLIGVLYTTSFRHGVLLLTRVEEKLFMWVRAFLCPQNSSHLSTSGSRHACLVAEGGSLAGPLVWGWVVSWVAVLGKESYETFFTVLRWSFHIKTQWCPLLERKDPLFPPSCISLHARVNLKTHTTSC